MAKYITQEAEKVREDLIGAKLVDFELKGKVLYLKNQEGRLFCIDCTGSGGAAVTAYNTAEEDIDSMQMKFNALLEKLDISEEDLYKIIQG